jgi:hypothetical protein
MTYDQIQAVAPDGLTVLQKTVAEGLRHEDYKRVTDLAALYTKIITGEGVNELLTQFVKREDVEAFDQRVRLTQAITPAVAASLISPFYKVPRANNISVKIEFESTEDYEAKEEKLKHALLKYNGDVSLDGYMEGRFVELNWLDPNAFIVTEFKDGERDELDNLKEPVQPYPWEVSSEEAVNFKYENNTLKWLVVRCGGKDMIVARHIIYLPFIAISFDPLKSDDYQQIKVGDWTNFLIDGEIVSVIKLKEREVYAVRLYEHTCELCPARRVGYKRDLVTKGRTFVSPIAPAMPYFMKSIKTVSEFDITMCNSAHPQKLTQAAPCTNGCTRGQMPDGGKCGHCKGSGVEPIATSAQDVITIPLARKSEDRIDLDNLVKYVSPDVALLEFQDKYIKELKDEARQAVYNSEIFNRAEVTATATEKKISMESVYDTLYPFAVNYSSMWGYQVAICAEYIDITDAKIQHRFPKDFQFRTRDELLAQQKSAAESQAPGYVKKGLSRELAESIFIDSPDELKRIRVKEMFHPFSDKTSVEIAMIINDGLTTETNKLLWANFDQIFDELEQEAQNNEGKYLYDLSLKTIKEKVDEKIKSLKEALTPEAVGGMVLDASGAAPTAVADSALNGAQIAGMVDIVEKAAQKGIPIDGAAELLKVSFPTVDPADIDKIINTLRNFKPVVQPSGFGGGF